VPGQPYFPKPSPKSVYREPAPVAPEAPPRGMPAKKPVVVSRPQDHPDMKPPSPRALGVTPRASTYWERHELLMRYPRPFGAIVMTLGGWVTWSTIDSLIHGGRYGRFTTIFGPVMFLSGVWVVLFGYPIDPEDGIPPRSWTMGYFGSALVGLVVGVGLAMALAATG
jgi:hypothetical protein